MSEAIRGQAAQPRRGQTPIVRRRSRARYRRLTNEVPVTNSEEAGLWACLEEREEGRLAQEADHLFDTSYAWAP